MYQIIYDYCSDEGYTETNIVEDFKGAWSELQEYIKTMRKNGCYNIVAAAITE